MKRFITIFFLPAMFGAVKTKAQTYTTITTIEYSISVEESIAIWAVLDSFIVNFREPLKVYLQKHLETYLFSHVRIASGTVVVISSADSVPVSYWRAGMPADWDHSAWVSRKIIQASRKKVHVAVVFRRFRKDNSVIADEPSFYILEKVNDKWGVLGRSSYAM